MDGGGHAAHRSQLQAAVDSRATGISKGRTSFAGSTTPQIHGDTCRGFLIRGQLAKVRPITATAASKRVSTRTLTPDACRDHRKPMHALTQAVMRRRVGAGGTVVHMTSTPANTPAESRRRRREASGNERRTVLLSQGHSWVELVVAILLGFNLQLIVAGHPVNKGRDEPAHGENPDDQIAEDAEIVVQRTDAVIRTCPATCMGSPPKIASHAARARRGSETGPSPA